MIDTQGTSTSDYKTRLQKGLRHLELPPVDQLIAQ